MNVFLNKLLVCLKKLSNFIPTKLPTGLSEFETWSNDILNIYEFSNNDSMKFSLAVMILHMDSTTASKSKRYFARALSKAMANQVVSQVIQDLKAKQQAEAAKQSEVTSSTGASDAAPQVTN